MNKLSSGMSCLMDATYLESRLSGVCTTTYQFQNLRERSGTFGWHLLPAREKWSTAKAYCVRKRKHARLMVGAKWIRRKGLYSERWDIIRAAKQMLSLLSLSKWNSLFQPFAFMKWSMCVDRYGWLTFGPLHNSHLGISEMVMGTVIPSFYSNISWQI